MSKLRLIQCGVGGMGKAWWSKMNQTPDWELVAIVDIVDAPLAEAGDALAIPADRRFKTLEAALDAVPADAILTVTPPAVHHPHARLAFSRGLHVMTEKPIADSLDNARDMARLAKQAGRQLVVTQNYRYRPFIQQLKRMIADKTAGEFGHGHLDFYIPADFTGTFRESMQYPLLVDMAVHHFDLIRCVTGRNIVKVTAQTFNPSWSWYQHHAGLKALLELEGGIPFSYSGDWSAKGKFTSWNANWRLQCADGSIEMENDKITLSRCEKWSKNLCSEPVEPQPLQYQDQLALLATFAQAIRTGQPAETSGDDNLWTFAAVTAGLISTREGRTVNVKDLLA